VAIDQALRALNGGTTDSTLSPWRNSTDDFSYIFLLRAGPLAVSAAIRAADRRDQPKGAYHRAHLPFPHQPTQPTMKMHRLLTSAGSLAGFLTVVLSPAVLVAAEESPSPRAAAPNPNLEQGALDQLKRMSATLGAAGALTFRTSSTVEVPAKTGQFITLFASSEFALKRPNKLRVRVTGEVPNFDFTYDGGTIVAYAPNNNVYSVSKAPGTIDEMLPFIEKETGIHFAAAYVLFSDPYAVLTQGLTSAVVVGSDTVQGAPCEHLAFRAPGVNWEIWIESGERALPRRLAITYTGETNFPRFLVEFSHWNLHPWLADGDFDFKKPADAKEIAFLPELKALRR